MWFNPDRYFPSLPFRSQIAFRYLTSRDEMWHRPHERAGAEAPALVPRRPQLGDDLIQSPRRDVEDEAPHGVIFGDERVGSDAVDRLRDVGVGIREGLGSP